MVKLSQPVKSAFQCLVYGQAQSVLLPEKRYTIYDKHCRYHITFSNPSLASSVNAPKIAAHNGSEGSWRCPSRTVNYPFKEFEDGLRVEDSSCKLELICDKDSPIYKGSR